MLVPLEVVFIGVIAAVFLVIFFFLYLELSTRRRRLVQGLRIILSNLPVKLSERKTDYVLLDSQLSEFYHNISQLLKAEPMGEEEEKRLKKNFEMKFSTNKQLFVDPIIQ